MKHQYLKGIIGLAVLIGMTAWTQTRCVGEETAKPPEETITAKDLVTRTITSTFSTTGFRFKAKAEFSIKGRKTNINIEDNIEGQQKSTNLSHLIMGSSDLGKKVEIYRQDTRAAVKSSKNNKWVSRVAPSPLKFIEQYQPRLENLKLSGEETVEKIPCRVVEATLNPDGIDDLVALFREHTADPKSVKEKSAAVKIWIGKADNLLYKISVQIAITIAPPSGADDEEDAEAPPGKAKPKPLTYLKLKAEAVAFDYNRPVDITVPDEVKKLWEDPPQAGGNK